jgi:serine/threonine protein kinase
VLVKQLLEAVHHLHQLNVMHGDLKPSNVLVNMDLKIVVKLCDLDNARRVDIKNSHSLKFTRGWVCPEVFFASKSVKSTVLSPSLPMDIFNLGLLCAAILHKESYLKDDCLLPIDDDECSVMFNKQEELNRCINCVGIDGFFQHFILAKTCVIDVKRRKQL